MPFQQIFVRILKINAVFLLCVLLLLANPACASSQLGGTYVSHGERFVNMLQLTQSKNGQITGVLNTMDLMSDGSISTHEASIISGTLDGDQLTLRLSILAIFGENIAGTINGSTIRLQITQANGQVLTSNLQRASLAEFNVYANRLKSTGDAIIFNSKLMKATHEVQQTISNAEAWIANAELHAQRIPGVKDHYQKIEEEMRFLIARERVTRNSVDRSQISVDVNQVAISGTQFDIDVNQLWDFTIGNSGQDLAKTFANFPANCSTTVELQKRGATTQTAEEWQSVCQRGLSEKMKFRSEYEHITEQRTDLKSFQTAAESRREALVNEANRIQ